jgi:hypothetical protein
LATGLLRQLGDVAEDGGVDVDQVGQPLIWEIVAA